MKNSLFFSLSYKTHMKSILELTYDWQCHQPHQVSGVVSVQVARLMEMGFSRGDALEALRASNNDLNVATNFLLQQ